jgi:hypothetical protein
VAKKSSALARRVAQLKVEMLEAFAATGRPVSEEVAEFLIADVLRSVFEDYIDAEVRLVCGLVRREEAEPPDPPGD